MPLRNIEKNHVLMENIQIDLGAQFWYNKSKKGGESALNRIVSVFAFALAVCCTGFLAYMASYFLGFRKSNLIRVTGYLEKTEQSKHVFLGHPFSGKWHKHWTICTYVYRVNGQPYSICCGMPGQRNDVPKKVTVTVQKHAPKYAKIPQMEKDRPAISLALILIGCVLFYAAGIALWQM